jgi:uncharacterized protein (TIGR02186 family)
MLYLLMLTPIWAQEPFEISIKPKSISIGTFYNGTDIIISGKIPDDCEAVAVFTGDRNVLHLKEKGKAIGLLWMNLDSLTYNNVPSVFLVSSQKRVEDMTGPEKDENSNVKNIGLAGLSKLITVESEKSDPQISIAELFKLKKHEELYQEQTGNITYTAPVQGYKSFIMKINIPSRLSPSDYMVNVYLVRNGQIIGHAEKPVEAGLTGIPAFLANLAFDHSLMYGILATIIAIAGGLVVGYVFQGAKEGSH